MFRKNCAKALSVFLSDPGSQIWHSAKFATCQWPCKEHFDVERGCIQRITGGTGNTGSQEQSSSHRSSIARSRDRIPIFIARRSVVSCCKHDQSGSASWTISSGRRSPASARRLVTRAKPFLQRGGRIPLSRPPRSRRDTGTVRDHWKDRKDLGACARNDLWEQQSRNQFAARFCRCGIYADSPPRSAS